MLGCLAQGLLGRATSCHTTDTEQETHATSRLGSTLTNNREPSGRHAFSALLPISVTMLCNLKANLGLVFLAATYSSCLQSRLLTLTNLITVLSLASVPFCPVCGPTSRPRSLVPQSTRSRNWINSRTSLKHGSLAWKHFPRMNLARAHPCACCPGSLGSW